MSKTFIDYDDLLDYINSLLGYTANLTREEALRQIKGYIIRMEKFQLSDELISRLLEEEVSKSPTDYEGMLVDGLMENEDDFDLHKVEVRWNR